MNIISKINEKVVSKDFLCLLPLVLVFIFSVFVFVSCANLGSPDGGPYDEDPPVVVRTTPDFGSSNTSVKKIVIEFNENVKLDNATEKVIISPPQLEQPEIDAVGKKITVKLIDSIKPNTTYTIDFSDAIKDNNEGNAMGDYAFTFSTGSSIDTMQVSGYVLDASNLEPIKDILVGVYELEDSAAALHDSVFRTKPFERVSRTDEGGHFFIKGLKKAYYQIFALKDQNQNYMYDQKSEMLAFTSRRFTPTARPDIKTDTIWHDSIYYDSIKYIGYTHFYPDDITLTAFTSELQDRFLLKQERPQLNMFSFIFTMGADTLPYIEGVNFDADSAFVIDATEHNDTINYWIRDSLVYNIDTLKLNLHYFATDTTGQLALMIDTLSLVSKISKAKMEKERQQAFEEWAKEYRKEYRAELRAKEMDEKAKGGKDDEDDEEPDNANDDVEVANDASTSETEVAVFESNHQDDKKSDKKKKKKSKIADEDIEIPPMPEQLMEVKVTPTALDPDKNIDFIFPEPIASVDTTKVHFYTKKDSIKVPEEFVLEKVEGKEMAYRLYAEWKPDSTYYLVCDTGMFVNIYGKRSSLIQKTLKVGSMETYSTLFVLLQNADTSAVVQLLDGSDKVVKTIVSQDGKADFYFLKPGKYYMRLFYDRNGNGIWDTGDYDQQLQPEEVFYYPNPMELKAQWEITQTFDPTSVALAQQKPIAITKQKDKKRDRTKKSKNQERLEQKQNAKSGTTNKASMPRF